MAYISVSKLLLFIVAFVVLSSTGYAVWKSSESIEIPKNDAELAIEEVSGEQYPVEIAATKTPGHTIPDASNWNAYSNDRYGFEVQYPEDYVLRSWDKGPIAQSRYILLRKGVNTDTTLDVVSSEEQWNLPLLGILDTPYLSYIRDGDRYARKELVTVGDREVTAFYFNDENPGAFGDGRDTIVVVIELGDAFLIIKRSPASEIDIEFQGILSTFQFDRY